jgi:hypothetical protein
MSLIRKTYNGRDLATELIPAFKAWARIDHTDDDNAITLLLARTISLLERQLGILIATQTWDWIPRVKDYGTAAPANAPENRLQCCNGFPAISWGFLPVPLRGITKITVKRPNTGQGSPTTDVTAQFQLWGDVNYCEFGQIYLQGINGATVEVADIVTLQTEVTEALLAYELVDIILRYALYLWENRESATASAMAEVPDFLSRTWGPLWSPRV